MSYMTLQRNGLSGLDGWMADLFGKPQSWYARVEECQNALLVLLAQVTAIGPTVWNTIEENGGFRGKGVASGYDAALRDLEQRANSMLITANYMPSDDQIIDSGIAIGNYREAVGYATRIAPEVSARVAADTQQALNVAAKTPLFSPAEAGEKEFVAVLKERARMFGGIGMGALAAIAALALLLFSMK